LRLAGRFSPMVITRPMVAMVSKAGAMVVADMAAMVPEKNSYDL
jgi:hypothetical protein